MEKSYCVPRFLMQLFGFTKIQITILHLENGMQRKEEK